MTQYYPVLICLPSPQDNGAASTLAAMGVSRDHVFAGESMDEVRQHSNPDKPQVIVCGHDQQKTFEIWHNKAVFFPCGVWNDFEDAASEIVAKLQLPEFVRARTN